jgi:hypothetical protein
MSRCFDSGLPAGKLDRVPFTFKHHLLDHPALTMEGLAEALPQLHPDRIAYSKGLSDLSINFDRAHLEHGNGLSLRETIETIRTSNSYIAVRDPVDHPAFRDLYESLRAEMTELQRQSGNSQEIHEPRMWLFIASPNAMTPFHFDRYSNVLMQIRGSKEVAVFPNFRSDIVPIDICEAYMDRKDVQAPWHPDLDAHAIKFDFRPGDTLHIPYTAGHYVKNGPEDVSISLSFFFQTDETLRWTRAMQFNHRVRKRVERFGMSPSPVGQNRYVDSAKARALPLLSMMWKLAS